MAAGLLYRHTKPGGDRATLSNKFALGALTQEGCPYLNMDSFVLKEVKIRTTGSACQGDLESHTSG